MPNQSTDDYPYFLIENTYYFFTSDGRTYSVDFVEQSFFNDNVFPYANSTFQLFLRLEKAPPAYSTDPKIGITVTAIIQDFVDKDPLRILFFTCDTADGRQVARFRKFTTWFLWYHNGNFARYDETITYTSGKKQFLITLLIRVDNPYKSSILQSYFTLTAQLRSQK